MVYTADKLPPTERTNRIGEPITRGGIVTVDVEVGEYFKAIHVGVGGDLVVQGIDGNPIPFYAVANSSFIPVVGNKILSTATIDGTTITTSATGITWHGGI